MSDFAPPRGSDDAQRAARLADEKRLTVFFAGGVGEILAGYSAYAHGVEGLTDTGALLDITPLGRQGL